MGAVTISTRVRNFCTAISHRVSCFIALHEDAEAIVQHCPTTRAAYDRLDRPDRRQCPPTNLSPITRSEPFSHKILSEMNTPGDQTYIDGFPALAAFIASDPDRSTFIYKRFNRLASRNLLIIQSELADMQSQLDAFDREDWARYQSRGPGYQAALLDLQSWEAYKTTHGPHSDRLKLVAEIRSTLKEYRKYMNRPKSRTLLAAKSKHF